MSCRVIGKNVKCVLQLCFQIASLPEWQEYCVSHRHAVKLHTVPCLQLEKWVSGQLEVTCPHSTFFFAAVIQPLWLWLLYNQLISYSGGSNNRLSVWGALLLLLPFLSKSLPRSTAPWIQTAWSLIVLSVSKTDREVCKETPACWAEWIKRAGVPVYIPMETHRERCIRLPQGQGGTAARESSPHLTAAAPTVQED